jgi:hypothetical protein
MDIVFTGETPSAVIGEDEIPNNVDLKIYKGDYYEFFVELQDNKGNIVDISSDIPKAQLRENYTSTQAFDLDTSVTDTGSIYVYISSAVCSTLDATKGYIWDLQTTNYKGDVKTWVTGDVTVLDEVTR